jgi:hypothetical protein
MISSQTLSNEPKQNRFLKVHPFRKLECNLQTQFYPFPPGPKCQDVTITLPGVTSWPRA